MKTRTITAESLRVYSSVYEKILLYPNMFLKAYQNEIIIYTHFPDYMTLHLEWNDNITEAFVMELLDYD